MKIPASPVYKTILYTRFSRPLQPMPKSRRCLFISFTKAIIFAHGQNIRSHGQNIKCAALSELILY